MGKGGITLTGTEMTVDPVTGYLTAGSEYRLVAFDIRKKVLFIESARKMWPRIGEICDLVGINRQTYINHLKLDKKFKADIDAIIQGVCDGIEKSMIEFSVRPQNFMDRIAILRAHRPDLYDPEKRILMTHEARREMTDADATEVAQRAALAVDAEIVREQFRESAPTDQGFIGEPTARDDDI